MQVTENILDPQYRKRSPRDIMHMLKTGCQRRMLPKDRAPCWHRPWDQRQQEDQRAQGTHCGCGRPLFFVRRLRCGGNLPLRGLHSLKKDAIKKTEEAFKKKYSGIKANIHRTFIGEYLAFSPNTQ